VLEEIERCDCPHFLILFRDSKLQFRGLYAYYPDTEEVSSQPPTTHVFARILFKGSIFWSKNHTPDQPPKVFFSIPLTM
jgi:hypothetical protein